MKGDRYLQDLEKWQSTQHTKGAIIPHGDKIRLPKILKIFLFTILGLIILAFIVVIFN